MENQLDLKNYQMQSRIDKNKERFIDIYNKYIKREGADKLLEYLKNSDFFIAPASSRYHLNVEGGLCEHSLNVYDNLIKQLSICSLDVTDEAVAIVALLHDLCKIDYYAQSYRNVKINNQWQQVPYYTANEKNCVGGHGSKSVFIINGYIKLTLDEMTAINCHMGVWNVDSNSRTDISNAFKKCTLAVLLHHADEMATFVTEENK